LLLIQGTTQEVDYDQMRSLLGVAEPAVPIEPSSQSHLDDRFYPWIATGVAALGLVLLMGGQLLFIPEGLVVETLIENDSASAELDEEEDQKFESIAVDSLDRNSEEGADLEDLFGDKEDGGVSAGSRQLFFPGFQKSISLSEFPMIGNPNAPHVIVEMLDYTCRHCRHLHPYIESTLKQHGNQVAFVIHHVPLNSGCNRHVTRNHPSTKASCDLARLAIGVWKLAPREFPEYHSWLMKSEKPPSVYEARERAFNIAGDAVLIDDSLKTDLSRRLNEQCYAAHRLKTGLPVLLTEQSVIKGIPSTDKQWAKFIDGQIGTRSTE